jgi:hypothetical protein
MKAPREIKQWISKARSSRGKPNGVVRWLFEHPDHERKLAKNKHTNRRTKIKQALRVN